MTARPLGTLITVALTPPRRKHVLMHFKLRGQIGQPNIAVGRITETIRKNPSLNGGSNPGMLLSR